MTILDAETIQQIIETFPECINEREKQVIVMRYGFYSNRGMTLQQIGDIFGVCRERVRQIEWKALRKIKHPSYLKALTIRTLDSF